MARGTDCSAGRMDAASDGSFRRILWIALAANVTSPMWLRASWVMYMFDLLGYHADRLVRLLAGFGTGRAVNRSRAREAGNTRTPGRRAPAARSSRSGCIRTVRDTRAPDRARRTCRRCLRGPRSPPPAPRSPAWPRPAEGHACRSAHWGALVRSHLLESPVERGCTSVTRVLKAIRRFAGAPAEESPGVGLGVEHRVAREGLTGHTLTLQGALVHAAFFTGLGQGRQLDR